MTIKWRLSLFFIQIFVLLLFTYLLTNKLYSSQTWFLAGLLAVIINPQLLEPFYPRPADIIGNSIIFVFLYLTATKTTSLLGWNILLVLIIISFVLAIISIVFGSPKIKNNFSNIARATNNISQIATAKYIYSSVFLLSVIDSYPKLGKEFWLLVLSWTIIIILGKINWQNIFSTLHDKDIPSKVEGMIGPNLLLISSQNIPIPGKAINILANSKEYKGIVINRVKRLNDIWGQVHLSNQTDCESIFSNANIKISLSKDENNEIIGSVDVGSTDNSLNFISTKELEIGAVVGVPHLKTSNFILFQLSSAYVERTDIKGGSHLIVQAKANQLGIFDSTNIEFIKHRWVPNPGAPVFSDIVLPNVDLTKSKTNNLLLGNVIGTTIPIFLDCSEATEGHLAILGMTKMGKTTLAERLANALSKDRRVTILDQTGEYVSKKGLSPCDKTVDWSTPGIAVFEPKVGENPAQRALDFIKFTVEKAKEEYKNGNIIKRTIIIDEAHQFIPEPSGLSFDRAERAASIEIGLLMMQIRKYGISIILISQRTAVVAKSALSQCENIIAFRSVDQTGLDYLEAVAGSAIRNILPQLKQGEALVFGPAISSDVAIGIQTPKPVNKIENKDTDAI